MLVILDCETSGLDPSDACIWQVAAVAVKDGQIVGEWSSRVRPDLDKFQAKHREVVQRISGLSDAQLLELLDAPRCFDVMVQFHDWCKEQGAKAWTAFNAAFDFKFIGVARCSGLSDGLYDPFHDYELEVAPCVMLRAAQSMGIPGGRVKLVRACAHFDIPFEESHDALNDARAAGLLAIRLGMG